MSTFVRRAGGFMRALLTELNGETFVTVSAIDNETVQREEVEDVSRTLEILEKMGRVELGTDPDGNVTARLTPDGVAIVQHMFGGGVIMASGTWGNIGTTDPDAVVVTFSMIDASGDRWSEQLVTALATTLAAIQAWLVLYQTVTQSSIFRVERSTIWGGAMDTSNADFGARFEVKNGINLSLRDSVTELLTPLRVIAPTTATMVGTTDIPSPNAGALADLITGTIALNTDLAFQSAQYTIHRERRGNPKVS